jgi:hypothetical protein
MKGTYLASDDAVRSENEVEDEEPSSNDDDDEVIYLSTSI